ncbi:MAG: PqqD family protein [Oscillospiraceae bacterium]|nr:PqqD family protein [Oscillospiraceae bacterium]
MTYTEYVKRYLKQKEYGSPVYISEIAEALADHYGIDRNKAAADASATVKSIADKGCMPELRRYRKGIYYRTTETAFGELGIDREKLIADRYILPDRGYETGPRLLNLMGLTSQVPAVRIIASNAAKGGVRYDERLGESVRPPRAYVTAENRACLQVLDALEMIDRAPVDAEDPYGLVAGHIRDRALDYETLLYYADRYYGRKTVIRLAHTAGLSRT